MSIVQKPKIQFDEGNITAFMDLITSELTPVFQGDFTTGLNVQQWSTPVVSGTGASVDVDSARLRVQSGTGNANYAYITNLYPLRYRAGQGQMIRFTPVFSSGIANNTQSIGVGTVVSNAIYDGYVFEFYGTSFGISHYNRGVATRIPQSSWNGDKASIALGGSWDYDPTKGSPVEIVYPYLGFGNINFFIQNPNTGRWALVHSIKYANTLSTTQLSNPNMYLLAHTVNTGNTTNKTMYMGSIGGFISGKRSFVGNPKGYAYNSKTNVTTEVALLSIRNCITYNGTTNRGVIRISKISLSSSAANGTATFQFKKGVTLGGVPSYTPRNGITADNGVTITSGNSIASFDIAATTVSGGLGTQAFGVDNPHTLVDDLSESDILIAPGEILTVTALSSVSSVMQAVINWSEEI